MYGPAVWVWVRARQHGCGIKDIGMISVGISVRYGGSKIYRIVHVRSPVPHTDDGQLEAARSQLHRATEA